MVLGEQGYVQVPTWRQGRREEEEEEEDGVGEEGEVGELESNSHDVHVYS